MRLFFPDDILDEQKQKIASELNLSETAFVSHGWVRGSSKLVPPLGSTVERLTLRWFTPTNEVPLCGHATVASAKVIFDQMDQTGDEKTIEFESKFSGILGATMTWKTGLITINFPCNPTLPLSKIGNVWVDAIVTATLGPDVPSDSLEDLQYSKDTGIVVIRIKDDLTDVGLRNVKPNYQNLLDIDTGNTVQHVIVTVKGRGSGEPDFYSRFFAPWNGINEDPVTGLGHTILTPYWTNQYSKTQENVGTLLARQHSTRGGDVHCTLVGDRVKLAGQSRITLKGQIFINN